jgi:hypothetical protein
MKKRISFIVLLVFFVLGGGAITYFKYVLTDYTYKFDGKTLADVYQGDITLTGNSNDLTLKAGSQVDFVIILGDENIIHVEEGAQVAAIRGYGSGNLVDAPPDMEIDLEWFKGEGNKRATGAAPSLDGL